MGLLSLLPKNLPSLMVASRPRTSLLTSFPQYDGSVPPSLPLAHPHHQSDSLDCSCLCVRVRARFRAVMRWPHACGSRARFGPTAPDPLACLLNRHLATLPSRQTCHIAPPAPSLRLFLRTFFLLQSAQIGTRLRHCLVQTVTVNCSLLTCIVGRFCQIEIISYPLRPPSGLASHRLTDCAHCLASPR